MKRLRFVISSLALACQACLCQTAVSDDSVQRFTPANSPYARRVVTDPFTLVNDLKNIDPEVLAAFHTKVEPQYIANRGERFNATDVVTENLPARRFVLAGGAPGIWFILYEHGGIAYHHNLVIFSKNEHWKVAAAVQGTVKGEANLESLRQAVKDGQFFELAGDPDF